MVIFLEDKLFYFCSLLSILVVSCLDVVVINPLHYCRKFRMNLKYTSCCYQTYDAFNVQCFINQLYDDYYEVHM